MSRERGDRFEQLALNHLLSEGMTLVERNYTCKVGEVDLVMSDGDTLVFVEVRYRESRDFGGALASVTPRKQRRIAKAAAHFLMTHHSSRPPACRFDVVGIEQLNNAPDIEWIRNAFVTQWH